MQVQAILPILVDGRIDGHGHAPGDILRDENLCPAAKAVSDSPLAGAGTTRSDVGDLPDGGLVVALCLGGGHQRVIDLQRGQAVGGAEGVDCRDNGVSIFDLGGLRVRIQTQGK